ncbi:MAG TPA: outer membrane beta-barrel protein [Saprospiraceae bacterium]|nr:outer membrane beta-barrel protein [Saprospiraceae bacterium]HMP26285.1 outer membrane beta-barrel protein [Saprospiraceae bacterium]
MLKRKAILLLLSLGLLQTPLIGQVFAGLSGGGGLNDRVSLRASLPVEFSLGKHWHLRTGLLLTQQHNPEILRKLDRSLDHRRVTISYLGVPLTLKGAVPTGTFTPYALGGLHINYGLRITTAYIEGGTYGSQLLDFHALQLTRYDIGAHAGLGVEKEINGRSKIFAELLFFFNFYDIDRAPFAEIYNEGQVFSIGILFPLKK